MINNAINNDIIFDIVVFINGFILTCVSRIYCVIINIFVLSMD